MAETLGELETQLRKRVQDELQAEVSEAISGLRNVLSQDSVNKTMALYNEAGEPLTVRTVLHEIERFAVEAGMPKAMKNAIAELLSLDRST